MGFESDGNRVQSTLFVYYTRAATARQAEKATALSGKGKDLYSVSPAIGFQWSIGLLHMFPYQYRLESPGSI